MKKTRGKASFFCQSCGNELLQWTGQCPFCRAWNTVVEAPAPRAASGRAWMKAAGQSPQPLSEVSLDAVPRLLLPYPEVNRVLGGGVVPGSLVLMAGEPGIGKSTLLLQLAAVLPEREAKVLYVTGEESPQQVKMRAQRLGISGEGILILGETNLEMVLEYLDQNRPRVVIVDSIQTLSWDSLPSGPGTVTQVRECGRLLMQWCKASGAPVLLAGHVTKEGDVAGPRVLEHMVDVVLYLEGDPLSALRILRCAKNRFGSTNEVAILQMAAGGLQEVPDPSAALLAERKEGTVGSAIVPVIEGSRPMLVEVQALTVPSPLAVPRRIANGLDQGRLVMLAAVLSQRGGLPLGGQDVILNVAGGLRISEPAADLAVALAMASSLRNTPLGSRTIAIGEVGLSGEIRSASQMERRLKEAARLGFTHALVPSLAREGLEVDANIALTPVATVGAALRHALATSTEGLDR